MVLVVKNPPANAGDIRNLGSISGWGRSPGERNGNPLQYSFPENPMDGGACWANVHGITQSRTQLRDRGAWRAIVHGVAKELDTT